MSRDLSIGNCQLRIQIGNYGDAYARLTHRGGSCYPGTGVYLTAAHSGSQFSIECQFWTAARPGCNLDHRMVTAHVRGRASTATVRGCPTANRADCRSVLYFVLW